ncbi:tetratricopeptide repeat protein [Plantactinospora sp. S1510]|uniref:Tetratricopeptide repeat protein n=1 Tax=Plantactinospora alkalitolerans TaxID=2789879 RepID=A0ABS0H0I0_9ACTN|nr:tetratricopeptide repeat protein [Plantactinospora alkalitolerans]MBF9131966.1 tetratricopeptide repeat protein [Plantactinospora alkalitolerans]
MGGGRILASGRDLGSGFAIAPRIVVTARHVVADREPAELTYVAEDGSTTRIAGLLRPDREVDVVGLELAGELASCYRSAEADDGHRWLVSARPKDNDPELTGSVTSANRLIRAPGGVETPVLQLAVDQFLGGYQGYSGSAVTLAAAPDVVIGVLVEQLPLRMSPGLDTGSRRPASNVLYAIPIVAVLRHLDLAAEVTTVPVPSPTAPAAAQTGDASATGSLAVPVGLLPRVVHGRSTLLRRLRAAGRQPGGRFVVLAGMGGVGKSTVAAEYGGRTRRPGRPVWWIPATDRSLLVAGAVRIARELGADQHDIALIGRGDGAAADRFWSLLDKAAQGWLLILDNLDDVEQQEVEHGRRGGSAGLDHTVDGRGWLRGSRRGLVLVTSRDASARAWGGSGQLVRVGPLDEDDAARALLDLAPGGGGETEAGELARRLGCLPLALRVAGTYLGSGLARWPTFEAYQVALADATSRVPATLAASTGADRTTSPVHTWDISLDSLHRRGVTGARGLLAVLAVFAPATPIPLELLSAEGLRPVLGQPDEDTGSGDDLAATVELTLHGLTRLGLLDVAPSHEDDRRPGRGLTVHPVVSDGVRAALTTRPGVDADAAVVQAVGVAVELLASYCARLDPEDNGHWPLFEAVVPHLRGPLQVPVVLGAAQVESLATAAGQVVNAMNWGGRTHLAETLARAMTGQFPEIHRDTAAVLTLRYHLAWAIAIRGGWREAAGIYHEVLDVREARTGTDSLETAAVRQNLAWCMSYQGRWAEAEAIYQEVHRLRDRILGPEDPLTLATLHRLGEAAGAQQRWEAAAEIYRRVLEARTRVLGPEHAATLVTSHEQAWVLTKLGRSGEAGEILDRTWAARRATLGDLHPNTMATRHRYGDVAAEQGRWSEAERIYREVLTSRRRVLGDGHRNTLTTLHALGDVLLAQGRWREAQQTYREAFARRRDTLGETHPDTIASADRLAEADLAAGRAGAGRRLAVRLPPWLRRLPAIRNFDRDRPTGR